jgi:beclin 1
MYSLKTNHFSHGSDSLSINRLFQNRRFEQALVGFLNCIQQMGESIERDDPNFKLPYRIVKDKIGDTSIKPAFSQDEAWTRGLKYCLINLKWILAWVSNK